jgi:hypothetical protein
MPVQMAPKDQGRRLHEGRKLLELFTFAGARVRLAAGRGPISKKAKSPVLHDRALCCFPVQGVFQTWASIRAVDLPNARRLEVVALDYDPVRPVLPLDLLEPWHRPACLLRDPESERRRVALSGMPCPST